MMRTVTVLVITVAILSPLHKATYLSPFLSRKSPSELVDEYDVIAPYVSSTLTHENYAKEIHVTLLRQSDTEKEDYQLHLFLNENLLSPSFASGYHVNGQKYEEAHENCFYHGKVKGHENWNAVFSTCYGLRGWFGDLHDQSNLYHIEPIEETTELTGPHALYMDTEHKNNRQGTCGTKSEHRIVGDLPDIESVVKSHDSHVLRKRQATDTLIVEWLIVNDYYQYMNYNSNVTAVTHRAIELANHVDMLYKVLDVRVVLVYSLTWTSSQLIQLSTDPDTILDQFEIYHRDDTDLRDIVHDSAMLITGLDVDGSTVGQAYLDRMCVYDQSVGFSQDSGSSINSLGGIAAHELGHIFSMQHDDDSSCLCPDTNGCIMNAFLGFPPPTQFSQCSRNELTTGLDNGGDICLDNNPTTLVGDPVCGNGIKEPGEVCDCGSVQECQDPCCNATTCMISDGNECAEGACCTSDCKFVKYGTTCRESGGECGIAEYCSGFSAECPRDVYMQNGVSCDNTNSYCYDGSCVSLNGQCEVYYGEASQASVEECYTTYNTQGVQFGHCGTVNNTFIACTQQNARCGSIQCDGGQIIFANIVFTSTLSSYTRSVSVNNAVELCQTFSTSASADTPSPGLVMEGTKCGDGKLCISQKCVTVSSLNIASCPTGSNGEVCSGNGVCNDLNSCSCNVNYNGTVCQPLCPLGSNQEICSGKGNCSFAGCACEAGYNGTDCSEEIGCVRGPNNKVCSGNGICSNANGCSCNTGYQGTDCSQRIEACPLGSNGQVCSGNGDCSVVDGCICTAGYNESDCSRHVSCPMGSNGVLCSGNGNCSIVDGCSCLEGYSGTDCSQRVENTTRTTNPTTLGPTSRTTSNNVGAIAGGVVGGLMFLILLVVVVILVVIVVVVKITKSRKTVSLHDNKSNDNNSYKKKFDDVSTVQNQSYPMNDYTTAANNNSPVPRQYNDVPPPIATTHQLPSTTVNKNARRPPPPPGGSAAQHNHQPPPRRPPPSRVPPTVASQTANKPVMHFNEVVNGPTPPTSKPTPPSNKLTQPFNKLVPPSIKPVPPINKPKPVLPAIQPRPTPGSNASPKPPKTAPKPALEPPQTAPKPALKPPQTAPKPSKLPAWPPASVEGGTVPTPTKNPIIPPQKLFHVL